MRLALRVTVASVVTLSAGLACASPAGVWKTVSDKTHKERAMVRITEAGGVFNARIERMLDPSVKPDVLCDKCSDDRKNKPIVGLEIVRGVKKSADKEGAWDGGTILDPENGKTYRVRLTPIEGGKKLEVRGYIGTPMLGRTQVWLRAD